MSTLTYPTRRKYPARLYELEVGQRITIRRRTYAPDVRDLEMFRHRIYFAARRIYGPNSVRTHLVERPYDVAVVLTRIA